MPLYQLECSGCGARDSVALTFEQHDKWRMRHHLHSITTEEWLARGGDPALLANPNLKMTICGEWRQVFDFHFNKGMPEHYSTQLDTVVKSDAHFRSELTRQADEYSARTGMETSFETVDPTDPVAAGVTDAGLEATERAHHDATSDGHKRIFT